MVAAEVIGFGMDLGTYLKVELIVLADVLDMSSCTNGWYHLPKAGTLWEEHLYVYGKCKTLAVNCYFGNSNGEVLHLTGVLQETVSCRNGNQGRGQDSR